MKSIAIIDDEQILNDQYRTWVVKALPEVRVDQYLTRPEAEQAIATKKYDLYILDIRMQHQINAGVGLAAMIGRSAPILVVSSYPATVYRSIMKEIGVWDYLQKGMFDEANFVEVVVDIMLEGQQQESEGLEIDLARGIKLNNRKLILPLTAMRMLEYIYKNKHREVTYEELAQFTKVAKSKETIRKHIEAIQNAFKDVGHEDPIANVRMVGYRWRLTH